MARTATNPKQQAHELIERLSTGQVSTVVSLFATMLDPVDRAIANAPFEDKEISEEETAPSPLPRLGSSITSLSPTRRCWPSSA